MELVMAVVAVFRKLLLGHLTVAPKPVVLEELVRIGFWKILLIVALMLMVCYILLLPTAGLWCLVSIVLCFSFMLLIKQCSPWLVLL